MIDGPSGWHDSFALFFASSRASRETLSSLMAIYIAKIPDTVLPCSVQGKTVGAEALELLPFSGCLWIKARWSTNAGSGAAFKDPDTSLAG